MSSKKQTQTRKPRPTTRAERAKRSVKTTDIVAVSGNGGGLVKKGHQGFLTTFTDEVGDKIIESVKQGMPLSLAANLHRVPKPTVEGWLYNGEDNPEHEHFGAFAADVRQAQAEFVMSAIEGIKDAGLSDAKQWTALMTLLERIYPEYFRRPDTKQTQNINIAVGVIERSLHELHEEGAIVYDGG